MKPFVPLLKHEADISNFANEFTKCEVDSNHNDSIDSIGDFEGFSFERKGSVSSQVLNELGVKERSASEVEIEIVIEEVEKMLA